MPATSLTNHVIRLLLVILSINTLTSNNYATAQRSLHHWKRDLEHRLRLYQENRNLIHSIISSSIYPGRHEPAIHHEPVRVASQNNVRFSDLIIPSGSLRLSSHVAEPTVRMLSDKTRAYVDSKTNELFQIQSQLANIQRQLNDPTNPFIYKGSRNAPQPKFNYTNIISGTRVFKQVQYAHLIESRNVSLAHINYTDVNQVIDDTYLRNLKFGVFDSQGRLYFEGRKTFWDTVFNRPLQSGCCDRLKPLHTNRMMLRSLPQDIQAPVLIRARDPTYNQGARIMQLSTARLFNSKLELIPAVNVQGELPLGVIGLLQSKADNFISLSSLINTRMTPDMNQPEIMKALVFRSPVVIDEAYLANSYPDNRLVIGIANMPKFYFDLSHENYLIRYSMTPKNYTPPAQKVAGVLVINGLTSFLNGVNAQSVNRISDFEHFVRESIVTINQPSVIQGPIQFNALPTMLNREASVSTPAQNVLILYVARGLDVGLVNGMRIPQDLIIFPSSGAPAEQNTRWALKPNDLIRIQGSRHFSNQAIFDSHLVVNELVNGLSMPGGVIPLHLNDFMSSVGYSNLWFMDGISLTHLTIQSNHLDDLDLRDINGDAQSLIMKSMLASQPDGSLLIRAPLRIMNLNLINSGPNRGLLNGFRPQEVLELNSRYPYETLYGRKTFLAPVEADDCIFSDINQVANWTNHLIRIDRPNTIQTVHTRLAFTSPPMVYYNNTATSTYNQSSMVNIDRMNVDFYPDSNPVNYQYNWNFSPELYLMQQALMRTVANYSGGRYRVNHVRVIDPSGGKVNNIPLGDIVTLDRPFRFADTFTMVGKVEVSGTLRAGRIQSNYPVDAMDLVQFDKYRIPIIGNSRAPIRLNNLVLGENNRASFVQCRMLNGISFNDFVQSIMSLTKPQDIYSNLVFQSPASFEGMVRTRSSLNSIKNFEQFANSLKSAKYAFEEGLQCNSVVVKT